MGAVELHSDPWLSDSPKPRGKPGVCRIHLTVPQLCSCTAAHSFIHSAIILQLSAASALCWRLS